MTYYVRKGSEIVASGLNAAAVQVAVDAARRSPGWSAIAIYRTDGVLVVRDDAGDLVTEEDWRARFTARFGRGPSLVRPAPASDLERFAERRANPEQLDRRLPWRDARPFDPAACRRSG